MQIQIMSPFKSLIRGLKINCISLTTVLKSPQIHSIVREKVLEYKLFSDQINSVCEPRFHTLLHPLHESILLILLLVKGSIRKTEFQMLNCSTPHKEIPIRHWSICHFCLGKYSSQTTPHFKAEITSLYLPFRVLPL